MSTKPTVLVVGATCLDIINFCNFYPAEDSDTRVSQQLWQKGGNACNSVDVLTQLDVKCSLMSTIGIKDASGRFVLDQLNEAGIDCHNCSVSNDQGCPTSTCIVSKQTGSRTIVHCRNGLSELAYKDFQEINLNEYTWLHFEGRGYPDVLRMLESASNFRSDTSHCNLQLSFELEKPRSVSKEIATAVLSYADVVFISKDVARLFGFANAKDTVINFKHELDSIDSHSILICPWAEDGCDAIDSNGNHYHADASNIESVVDTLAAGDTLVAGVVSALLRGKDLSDAIKFGCWLASKKCTQQGLKNLLYPKAL